MDARRAMDADQAASDAEQTAADADQTASDADQTASARDQAMADQDQRASEREQEAADRDRASGSRTVNAETLYAASREQRETDALERFGNRLKRSTTARDRDATAIARDRVAEAREVASRARAARAAALLGESFEPEVSLLARIERLAAQAAADRERAAEDRARAATDRARAALERAKLETELDRAHLDDLTGAYRRGVGRQALSHEIARARRSDRGFVVAFVDVDGFKEINDRDGHAAGDRVLQTVVRVIRGKLRSFDPVMRYGGDEFVCGLSGTHLAEARNRFRSIAAEIEAEAKVGISVGLAELKPDDTVDRLTERADAAMLKVKARRHAKDPVPVMARLSQRDARPGSTPGQAATPGRGRGGRPA